MHNLFRYDLYLNRTSFDGWIERAFPFSYKGKRYVIGLGQIVTTGNNDRGTRTSQATLFEIVEKRGKTIAEVVHQIAFTETNGWSQLRGEDKLTTFRMTGDGKGQILFSQTANREGRWISGGKLVNFDLSRVDEDAESVFTEGAFLEGSAGYLKRVFYNNDIARIASLSDQALAIYGDMSKADSNSLVKASYVLELSRNIRAYLLAGYQQHQTGLQIVSVGNSWYSSEAARTEIRFVPLADPDQEKQPNMRRLSMLGDYQSHELLTPDLLAVLTTESSYTPEYKQVTRLYMIELNKPASSADSDLAAAYTVPSSQGSHYRYMRSGLIKLSEREVLVSTSDLLAKVGAAPAGPDVTEYKMPDLKPDPGVPYSQQSVLLLDGHLYLSSVVTQHDGNDAEEGLDYRQNFLSSLTLTDGKVVIGAPINIPGQPVALKGQQLITSDQWVLDLVRWYQTYNYDPANPHVVQQREPIEQNGLISLELGADVATLKDTFATSQHLAWTVVKDASLVSLESPESGRSYGWPYGGNYYDSPGIQKFHFLSTENYLFRHEVRGLYANTSSFLTINAVFEDPLTPDGILAVLGSNTGVRVVRWSAKNLRPELVPLKTSVAGKGCENYLAPGMGWWTSAMSYHFTPDQNSLELALGYGGVRRIYLDAATAEAPKASDKP
jgi:hypothetical protein